MFGNKQNKTYTQKLKERIFQLETENKTLCDELKKMQIANEETLKAKEQYMELVDQTNILKDECNKKLRELHDLEKEYRKQLKNFFK